jgi:16S rRNA (cytosine1402-N4)-methyltransferase
MKRVSVSQDAHPSAAAERHVPVLLAEVIEALDLSSRRRVIDGTFGAGGYTRAILDASSDCHVMAIDRDPSAIAAGRVIERESNGRLSLVEGRFGDLADFARDHGFAPADAIVLDIGVSSMQLDEAARGFSFRADGPLDMRMEQKGESAADLVNTMDESDLADLIYKYGEERKSRAVARAIVKARAEEKITTTKRLADIVASAVYAKHDQIHPATRTFQALRIAVNDELGELERALQGAEDILVEGGRLAVVTFHSLEDRIVKQFIADRANATPSPSRHMPDAARDVATFKSVTRKPIVASEAEMARNPRARSAKLRVAERTAAPAFKRKSGRA